MLIDESREESVRPSRYGIQSPTSSLLSEIDESTTTVTDGRTQPAMFPSSSSTSSEDEGEAMAETATASVSDCLSSDTGARPRTTAQNEEKFRRKVNVPKKDDYLFSLKQFLKNNNQRTNQQFAGARPKVYEPQSRTPEPSESHDTGKYPRNPTELPDFVQDHLVIEQCYLGDNASSNLANVEVENLPDFALNSVKKRHMRFVTPQWKKTPEGSPELCFDLTDHLDKGPGSNPSRPSSLYLPELDDNEPADVIERLGFPFDLQIPRGAESNSSADGAVNHPLPEAIPNTTKLLPDFLSDAPICSRGTPERPDCSGSSDSMNHWLSVENERLRNELQIARRQASERSARIEALEAELLSRRQLDHTENLEKAKEQVEDNLKRSTKRAITAESKVASLKKEIDALNMEILMLRTENRALRNTNPDRRIQRLADDLRLAASTAEVSLRQLMSGVNNLRVIASALENADKIEDRTKDFLPDFDEDNAAGPAL